MSDISFAPLPLPIPYIPMPVRYTGLLTCLQYNDKEKVSPLQCIFDILIILNCNSRIFVVSYLQNTVCLIQITDHSYPIIYPRIMVVFGNSSPFIPAGRRALRGFAPGGHAAKGVYLKNIKMMSGPKPQHH